MANSVLDPLVSDVTDAVGVMDSATTLINGFQAKLAAAIAAALAGGATAAELAPLTALDTDLKAKSGALSAAVAANP